MEDPEVPEEEQAMTDTVSLKVVTPEGNEILLSGVSVSRRHLIHRATPVSRTPE